MVESEMSAWAHTVYEIQNSPTQMAGSPHGDPSGGTILSFDSYKRQIKVSCFYSVRFSHPLALPPVLSWECRAGRCSAHPAARPAAFPSCSRPPVFAEKRLVRFHPFVRC